ncbi:tyrosine-type recombinase/integrase [Novosphingobium panipatense]
MCLSHLLRACRRDLLGLRDEALLRTAYDSAGRRSELVAIHVDHVDGPDANGAGRCSCLRARPTRKGRAWAYLSPATMNAIARWRDAGHVDCGALFRRVETHFDGSVRSVGRAGLHPNSITLIYKRLIRSAFDKKLLGPLTDAELKRWLSAVSSHSIRVGVAQDNFAAGESLPAIMQAYRWRDPRTVMRYGARLATKSGAGARMAARMAVSSPEAGEG